MKKLLFLFVFSFICLFFGCVAISALNISSGDYYITSLLNNNKALDISGNYANGTNVQIYDLKESANQSWHVEYVSDGYYTIASKDDPRYVLDVAWGSRQDGTNVQLYEYNGTDSQLWAIIDQGNENYVIKSKLGNIVLDVAWGNVSNGSNIQVYTPNGSNAQGFKFRKIMSLEKTVENGDYYITSLLNNNKSLDIAGNYANGTNVQIYDLKESVNQSWHVEYVSDGYYTIASKDDPRYVLDVAWGSRQDGTNVQLYEYNGTNSQLWAIIDQGNENYVIKSKLGNIVLDVAWGNVSNGSNIQVYTPNGSNAQGFKFRKIMSLEKTVENGDYYITSLLNNNKSLDISGNYANGTNVQIYDLKESANQSWHVEYVSDGYYTIASKDDPRYVLDVAWGSRQDGTNVQLYEYNGTNSQLWAIIDQGNENYVIKSKLGNIVLDVAWGNVSNGSNIQVYTPNGSNAQGFKFVKVKDDVLLEDGNYVIKTASNKSRAISIDNDIFMNSSNIQTDIYDNNWNQIWHIERLDSGYYFISNILDSRYVLDVAWGIREPKTNVQLYEYNGTDSQLWKIEKNSNGSYTIISKLGNFALDIGDNNTNIQIDYNKNYISQNFIFEKVSSVPLKDGIYKIGSSSNTSKIISIDNNYVVNNSNISLSFDTNSNGQKWFLKSQGYGYYTISSTFNDSYFIDLASSINSLQLYRGNGSYNQLWYIKYVDGGYVISSKLNGKTVNYEGEINESDKNNAVVSYEENDNSRFSFEETEINNEENVIPPYSNKEIETGYYKISSSINSDLMIDLTNGSKVNGTNIQVTSNTNDLNQVWYIERNDDGSYSITSALNRSTALDIPGGYLNSGNSLQLYRYNDIDIQKWYIRDTEDGNVTFVSKAGDFAIDLDSLNIGDGSNVVINNLSYSETQKFKLEPYTDTKIYKGIDVSSHNGTINWGEVANEVDFAIIRLGYGGGEDGRDDTNFIDNVRGCEEYNIPYGVYLYSYALNSDIDTTVEIEHARNLLSGINPNLGTKVFFDMEDADNWKKRYGVYDDNVLLNTITDKFCAGVESFGYSCGIYANVDWLTNKLDAVSLANKYTIWVAIWPDNSTINNFSTAYNMRPAYNLTSYNYWQFTSNGYINGINGAVDLNLGYDIFD